MASPKQAAPAVSVIIPTCNRPDMLERSLGSVLAQTMLPLEIIVVNDAGTPVEATVARLDKNGLVRVINHASNQGAAAARNTALRTARGHYIAFLDDDDLYLPHHLATVVPALAASDCRFGYGFAEYVINDMRNGKSVVLGTVQPYTGIPFSLDSLLVANFIPTPTWVFARSLIEEVGLFDEFFAACEDWDWLLRACRHTSFLPVQAVTVEVHQRLYDRQHLILQHQPRMNEWIQAVYDKHPIDSPDLELARIEHMTFGIAEPLPVAQTDAIAAAFAAASAGTLDIHVLFQTTALLDRENRRHRSVLLYREWLAHTTSPLRHAVLFNLGAVLQNLGQSEAAERHLREALAHSPSFNLARFQLATLLERRGNVDEALGLWRAIARATRGTGSPDLEQANAHLRRFLEL